MFTVKYHTNTVPLWSKRQRVFGLLQNRMKQTGEVMLRWLDGCRRHPAVPDPGDQRRRSGLDLTLDSLARHTHTWIHSSLYAVDLAAALNFHAELASIWIWQNNLNAENGKNCCMTVISFIRLCASSLASHRFLFNLIRSHCDHWKSGALPGWKKKVQDEHPDCEKRILSRTLLSSFARRFSLRPLPTCTWENMRARHISISSFICLINRWILLLKFIDHRNLFSTAFYEFLKTDEKSDQISLQISRLIFTPCANFFDRPMRAETRSLVILWREWGIRGQHENQEKFLGEGAPEMIRRSQRPKILIIKPIHFTKLPSLRHHRYQH